MPATTGHGLLHADPNGPLVDHCPHHAAHDQDYDGDDQDYDGDDNCGVTRLGDFLYYGQLFKAFGNKYFAQIFLGNFCKGVKIYHFSSEIIFGQLLQTFGNFYLVTLMMMAVLGSTIIKYLEN